LFLARAPVLSGFLFFRNFKKIAAYQEAISKEQNALRAKEPPWRAALPASSGLFPAYYSNSETLFFRNFKMLPMKKKAKEVYLKTNI